MKTKDQILGSIIGGAIGDYVGGPFENRAGGLVSIPAHSVISDDTQLTLATCEALSTAGKVDPATIAEAFKTWFLASRITGVGSSTLKALRDLSFGAPWTISGAGGERAAGNGAAMRISPLGLILDPWSLDGQLAIRDVCRITHKNDEAIAGAFAVAGAIVHPDFDFLDMLMEQLPDSNTRDRLITMAGLDDPLQDLAAQFGAGGYVAESVPLALIAANRAAEKNFEVALLELIACGGDTDTMGSIFGQVVGSKMGYSQLPTSLKVLNFGAEPVLEVAETFANQFGSH